MQQLDELKIKKSRCYWERMGDFFFFGSPLWLRPRFCTVSPLDFCLQAQRWGRNSAVAGMLGANFSFFKDQ